MEIRFSARAETDIVECYLYSFDNFGRHQAARYEQGLRDAIRLIGDNPRIAAERHEFTPPIRIHRHAKHYIVYLIGADHVLIVRILRDEMDLARHLGNG